MHGAATEAASIQPGRARPFGQRRRLHLSGRRQGSDGDDSSETRRWRPAGALGGPGGYARSNGQTIETARATGCDVDEVVETLSEETAERLRIQPLEPMLL
jgi:hypothetical protein